MISKLKETGAVLLKFCAWSAWGEAN